MTVFFTRFRVVLCVLVCCTTLLPASARAQQSPITFDVAAGYEGAFHVNEWFPVRVTVANSGPDVRGQLIFDFANNGTQPSRSAYEIDLPQGARKQVTMYAAANDFGNRNGQISLVENGRELAKQAVRLEPLSSDQLLLVVASSDPALLNSLSGLVSSSTSSSTVRHIDLATLPEQTQGLNGIDALFLHDLDTNTLNERQRAALELWVQNGGKLIVSGGNNGAQAAAGVANLLPVEVTGGFRQGSLQPLATGNTEGLPSNSTLSEVRPQPNATALFGATDLGYQRRVGQGMVAFTAFDLAATRGWRGETELWENVLDLGPRLSLGGVSREQSFNVLADALRSNSLALIPVWVLLILLALYILAIGPLNYLLLRRLGKLEWAWGTIPLVVLLFVAGVYGTGRVMRGNDARLTQITVVQTSEGQPRGTFTAYSGLFSPDRTRYTFSYAPETLVQELRSFDDFGSSDSQIVASDAAAEVRNTLVDIRSIRTVLSESSGETGVAVESNMQTSASTVRGDLRYSGAASLEDAIVVRGEAFQDLGTLETGATTTVDFNTTTTNYPWSLDISEVASIDRKNVLTRINDINQYNQGIIDPEAVYLIGWRNTPSVNVRVNGNEIPSEGVTLYIIQLNG